MFPKNRGGPPKWRVKIMEILIKMDDLGPTPIFGNTQMIGTIARYNLAFQVQGL